MMASATSALLLLLATSACASDPHGFPHDPHGGYPHGAPHGIPHSSSYISLDELEKLLDAVVDDLKTLGELISDVKTLCHVVDADTSIIFDVFHPKAKLYDEQQDALIEEYASQIKGLRHRVDDAKAKEKQELSLAEATYEEIFKQLFTFINGSIVQGVSTTQFSEIYAIRANLTAIKTQFLESLNMSIDSLNLAEDDNEDTIEKLEEFVNKRKCEIGYFYLTPANEEYGFQHVNFKTRFDVKPSVFLAMAGFKAHLDVYGKGYDKLDIKNKLGAVSLTGFDVKAVDDSEGTVDFTTTAVNFMACQFLDIDIPHPDVTRQ